MSTRGTPCPFTMPEDIRPRPEALRQPCRKVYESRHTPSLIMTSTRTSGIGFADVVLTLVNGNNR